MYKGFILITKDEQYSSSNKCKDMFATDTYIQVGNIARIKKSSVGCEIWSSDQGAVFAILPVQEVMNRIEKATGIQTAQKTN